MVRGQGLKSGTINAIHGKSRYKQNPSIAVGGTVLSGAFAQDVRKGHPILNTSAQPIRTPFVITAS